MCTNVYVCTCHCEFTCHRSLGCNHKLQNLEPGLRESLRVGPDLPVSDTDSSSPPASLSHLPSEGLTPYCQCRRLNGDLFYNPPPTPTLLPSPLHFICHHLWSVCTSPCVFLLLPTFLPSFTQSRLSQLTEACQMFPQLQVHPSLSG